MTNDYNGAHALRLFWALDPDFAKNHLTQLLPQDLVFAERLSPKLLCEDDGELGSEMLERNVAFG